MVVSSTVGDVKEKNFEHFRVHAVYVCMNVFGPLATLGHGKVRLKLLLRVP